MILERLRLHNFRCYAEAELVPDERFNVFVGLNGQGKTTLLEAIGLVTFLRSFRNAKNADMLRTGCDESRINATVRNNDLKAQLEVRLWEKRRQATFNGKTCRFISEYIGRISAVSFCPSDLEIVRAGPEHRRHWIDRVCQIIDPAHADAVARYQKVIDQRNRLLKQLSEFRGSSSDAELATWTEELLVMGAKIVTARLAAIEQARDPISRYYGEIAGRKSTVEIRYKSPIFDEIPYGQAPPHSLELVARLLEKSSSLALPKERILGTTLVGPHRDDLDVFLDGRPVKSFGSQGEARSIVLAMRLTEVEMHRTLQRLNPIVLIDDFSSELDAKRRTYLLDYLSVSGSQVFLSTTEELRIGRVFEIQDGKASPTGETSELRRDGHATDRYQ